ncbi:MAG: DUF4389 domain-containing protein [Rhodobacteraceae bacterium]|nr:DUF4389 domain-containing protein [Paracoccaceae bacterium]
MNEFDDGTIELEEPGRGTPKQPAESIWKRLLWMVLIAIMISLAQTVLLVTMIIQFVIMLTNKGEPNERISEFGTSLGIWIAKAARFQTAGSEVRPWPWTDLD